MHQVNIHHSCCQKVISNNQNGRGMHAPGLAAQVVQPVPAGLGSAAVVPPQLIAHSAAELWLLTRSLPQTGQPEAAVQL